MGAAGAEEKEAVLRLRPPKNRVKKQEQSGNGVRRMEEQQPVSPAGRLYLNDNFFCNIYCVIGLKKEVDLGALKQALCDTLVHHHRFCSLLKVAKNGREYWSKVDVKIDEHVVVVDLEEKRGCDRVVEEYVADLSLGSHLDRSRPLWDVHVLNYRSRNAASSVVFRIHHALGDGVSLMSLLLACTRRVDNPELLPSVPSAVGESKKGAVEVGVKASSSGLHAVLRLWRSFWRMLLVLWNTVVDMGSFVAINGWQRDDDTAIKGYLGVEKLPKKIVVTDVSMQDMKAVKLAVNGTVNDVLMGMIALGLRKYLVLRAQQDVAAEPEEKKAQQDGSSTQEQQGGKLPEKLRVRAVAFVNVRPSPGLHELAEMMKGSKSQARWGNKVGLFLIPVPLDDFPTALDYVKAAKALGDKKKASLGGLLIYASAKSVMALGGPDVAATLINRLTTQTSFTVSNVMGPAEEVALGGNPVTHIFPTVTGHPHALSVHMQTYAGKVSLVATAVKAIIPDPEILLQCCVDALEEMKKTAVALPSANNA